MARQRSQPPQGPKKRSTRSAAGGGGKKRRKPAPLDDAAARREEENELRNFDFRGEWFRLYHAEASGWTSDERVRQAVEHAVLLEQEPPQMAHEPRDKPPRAGSVAVAAACKGKAKLRKAENARPNSSLGFIGDPVDVRFDPAALPDGVDILLGLDPKLDAEIQLSSVRMFRYDDDTQSWVLIRRSGVGRDLRYAWARAHRPGTYVAVGLPADPVLLHGLLLLAALRPQLEVARRTKKALRDLVDSVGELVFAGEAIKTFDGELPGGLDFGSFDLPSSQLNLSGFRRRMRALDLPEGGLPEWEILEDIAPTWRPPGAGWPWPPISWPPGLRWPKVLWPLWPSDWSSVGPRNINGRIKSLAIHPVTENVLWAGAANGGVWKSVNGGATWLPMMSQERSLAIGGLAVAPSDPWIVYAATGEDTDGWTPSWPGVGVYKTTDAGASWTLSFVPSTRCTRVVVHPSNPDVVYVAGTGGLHKSTNGGQTWTKVLDGHVSDVVLDFANPFRLYAGVANSGVFRTTNGGGSWTLMQSGITTGPAADWIKLAIGRFGGVDSDLVLAKMGPNSGSIFRTTDGGISWGTVATNIQNPDYNEWTNVIAVDPNNQQRIIAGGVGISLATDGRTFGGVTGGGSDHHSVVYSPEDSRNVFIAADSGVYRSTDGGATWNLRSYDLVATQLYSIGVSQTPTLRLGGATQDQGIILTTGASDWTTTNAGNEGGFFIVDPNDDRNIYVTPWNNQLRRSTNGGSSWTNIQNGLLDLAGNVAHAHDLAVQPGNSNVLVCVASQRIFKSTNQGNNWTTVLNLGVLPTRVAFTPSDASICYATTENGVVFKSVEAGDGFTWEIPYLFADGPPRGVIGALATSHTDSNRVYIGYAGFGVVHVWRSDDGGAHWTPASGTGTASLPDIPVNALAVHHLNSDIVYAATDIGVFRTTDGGTTWQTFNQGMPRAFVSGLAYRRSSRTLYASTMGRGAYSRRVWFG